MTFHINEDNFYLDGKKTFLISGEIHYFRIRRNLWEKHLAAAKEAGLRVISSYVPWVWHEPEESVFDLEGKTCPERDLRGWLELCKAHGLFCILKPGPFILAEYRGAGLPDWFMDRYADEIKMHNSRGEIVRSDGASIFNKHYLEKVTLWYDRIMPFIRDHEISAGGPVIMMQICNEIGVFPWLAHQGDYCDETQNRFVAYLSRKFKSVAEINASWGTDYPDFEHVPLPPDGREPYSSKGDLARDHEWHLFWRTYYGDYLKMLSGMARARGVTVPFYHNLPGWIYGSGFEFPVNITMYDDLFGEKSDIIFGVDHIPEYLSYRNMHDDRIINDIVHAMQGNKPLFAAEFQSGSREYHVVPNPREMELFYKASVAHGLTGWNYYMFSQGKNPERKGYSGDTFYWFTPLNAEGERSIAFPLVKKMNRILGTLEDTIVKSRRKAEICVLFYSPYYATELERPAGPGSGLLFNPSSIRRPAYFDGLLKALQFLNVDYDMLDLKSASVTEMKKYRQVWAFATDEMDAPDQQKIVDYAHAGGYLVIFPCLPDRDLSERPCTMIREALAIKPSGTEVIDSPLVDVLGNKDIKCANPVIIYDEKALSGAEVIARTIGGTPCGFEKALGKGTVLHLGTWTGFDTEGQVPVYESVLSRSGADLRHASASPYLNVSERFTGDGSALLFIANYYNEERSGVITYTHPKNGKKINLPVSGKEMTWPALYGILTPVCLEIAEDLTLLHTTSDLLDISKTGKLVKITLCGDRDLQGEIVFEGKSSKRIRYAETEGEPLEIGHKGDHAVIRYRHSHRKEMVLNIKID